ncbi:hypothetical protein GWI33_018311 [Rhynchophorus ferrugineus]|uniref:28S ribosomal protein S9, mitochondrial n=1 Tax=Rhynchophorus ferrugineus TaxID=354439 RepID=A0A834M2P3_RHYFE|nr:hypothetical protein GWI33_018311 [Rhynchophorus ferrugineus]
MIRGFNLVYDPFRIINKNTTLSLNVFITTVKNLSTTQVCNEKLQTSVADVQQKKTQSKAMKLYLERAREHDEFMKTQRHEYEIGKRHLANMMGENPETFTQKDVDEAIEYLFPSGLYDKKARPLMKSPEEVFPQRKAAEFDETGRPFHFLFYTGRPYFYQILHDAVQKMNDLYKFESAMVKKGLMPDPNLKLELSGYQWIDKGALETMVVESLTLRDYETFINTLERLSELPYSYREKDFVLRYCKPLLNQTKTFEAIQPQVDSDGRQVVTVYDCCRKTARATVTLRMPGTGKIDINGKDITYFNDIQSRDQMTTDVCRGREDSRNPKYRKRTLGGREKMHAV